MTAKIKTIGAAILLVAAISSGCKSGDSAPAMMASATPTTMASVSEATLSMGTPPTTFTHVLTKDEPIFASEPSGPNDKPAATLKQGSKVLVMLPGAMYSQVTTEKGATGYTLADGLKPLGK